METGQRASGLTQNGKPALVYTAKFAAVTNGSPENERFFKWTPSMTLDIGTIQEAFFEVSEEYYLDFIPAKEEALKEEV